MSPTRRRPRKVLPALSLALVIAAASAAVIVGTHGSADSSAAGSSDPARTAAPAGGADAAALTSSAPFTIKPEPRSVATDAPVTTGGGVDVVLTYAAFDSASSTVQANGFAAGVIEDGGTCTLTLSQGDTKVTATSTAVADATTTSCGLLETSARPAAGTWDAVLTYASDHAHGKSGVMKVTVP